MKLTKGMVTHLTGLNMELMSADAVTFEAQQMNDLKCDPSMHLTIYIVKVYDV